jgi:hypothetical protein
MLSKNKPSSEDNYCMFSLMQKSSEGWINRTWSIFRAVKYDTVDRWHYTFVKTVESMLLKMSPFVSQAHYEDVWMLVHQL